MIQVISDNKLSRADQIEQIIEKRQPLVKQIEIVQNNLNSMSALVNEIGSKRDRLLEQVEDTTVTSKLNNIDCKSIVDRIRTESNALQKLKSRFSRQTLNIGVVGRARQGKSRLLQSLTGLSKSEIPDGDGQHCTGVRSNIYHVANQETYADVYFHSEHSFLNEVIAPYYSQLGLGLVPSSLEMFANSPLPELDTNKGALEKAKYKHLGQYHQHIDRYRHFFSQTTSKRISKEQIREYVAQDTVEGDRTYFAYLAVSKVDIFCSFPNQDIGQVSLVDMPGLGDTGIGDAERLIKTLGQDIDIVLFMRMPKSMGDVWAEVDVSLYDLANSALTDLPIQEWSFMVLNHIATGDNYKNCIRLKDDIQNQYIDVQDVIICDCANEKKAQTAILDRVIDYLTYRIDILDNKYASACQYRLLELQRQIEAELDKADSVFAQASSYDWSRYSVRLFHKLWNELRENLVGLSRSMIQYRDVEDVDFRSAVEQAIKDCRNYPGIPSISQIIKKQAHHGSFESAYSECQHQVRTQLSNNFHNLNISLKKSLERSKSKVAEVLAEHAKLKYIAEGEGSEFLFNVSNKIPEDLKYLKSGFITLATFDLEYHGLIQHRIRKHLDILTPDRSRYKFNDLFSNFFGQPNSDVAKAKKIHHNLRLAQMEAVNNCEEELINLLVEPSQAGFAIVEEFVARVLRAEGMEEEWEIFLQEFATQIWQEKFDLVNASSLLKKEWRDTVRQAQNKNSVEEFKFTQ